MKPYTQKPFFGWNRELVTNPGTLAYWSRWQPHTGHRSGRWHISRGIDPGEDLTGKSGALRLFKSHDTAQQCADKLNSTPETP